MMNFITAVIVACVAAVWIIPMAEGDCNMAACTAPPSIVNSTSNDTSALVSNLDQYLAAEAALIVAATVIIAAAATTATAVTGTGQQNAYHRCLKNEASTCNTFAQIVFNIAITAVETVIQNLDGCELTSGASMATYSVMLSMVYVTISLVVWH
ncbi:uncharacterized protein [Haliotis asinina]|uniref:uncharacterized protein n=1 Tax=Haliotis asinina TaxID=109174 RepID=UPI003531C80E